MKVKALVGYPEYLISAGDEFYVDDVQNDRILVKGVWFNKSNFALLEPAKTHDIPINSSIRKCVKSSNPKDRAATTRLDLSLWPETASIYGALAMTEGDCKYGGFNFREQGASVSTYYAALRRHMIKFYNGEWADEKTKVPHLANMLGCIAILVDGFEQGNIIDDRPPRVDCSQLLDDMENHVKVLQELFKDYNPVRATEKN